MRALIVEDDGPLGFLWQETVASLGIEVELVNSCQAATRCLLRNRFDVCLLDLFVEDGPTSSLADWIKVRTPDTPVIVITGSDVCPRGEYVKQHGIDWMLRKPVRPGELKAMVEYLLPSLCETVKRPTGTHA